MKIVGVSSYFVVMLVFIGCHAVGAGDESHGISATIKCYADKMPLEIERVLAVVGGGYGTLPARKNLLQIVGAEEIYVSGLNVGVVHRPLPRYLDLVGMLDIAGLLAGGTSTRMHDRSTLEKERRYEELNEAALDVWRLK